MVSKSIVSARSGKSEKPYAKPTGAGQPLALDGVLQKTSIGEIGD